MELISFSYKRGPIPKADLVIDCRDLPNPHHVPELKVLNGLSPKVQDFLKGFGQTHDLLDDLIDNKSVRRDIHTIAFGCVGGIHRSVAMVELFAGKLKKLGENPLTTHSAL